MDCSPGGERHAYLWRARRCWPFLAYIADTNPRPRCSADRYRAGPFDGVIGEFYHDALTEMFRHSQWPLDINLMIIKTSK